MKKALYLLLCLCLLLCTLSACGQNKAATMRLIKTEGEVGVSDGAGKDVSVIENLGLYSGYHVATLLDSFAWIDLDETKLAKMDMESSVEIKKDGKKLAITVNAGSLFFNVTKPLEADESMDIRASTMIAGIRGTCGWVECRSDSIVRVALLEGKVACSTQSGDLITEVSAGELAEFVIRPDGSVTFTVKPLVASDIPAFIADETLPGGAQAAQDSEPGEGAENGLTVTDEDIERIVGSYTNDLGNTLGIGKNRAVDLVYPAQAASPDADAPEPAEQRIPLGIIQQKIDVDTYRTNVGNTLIYDGMGITLSGAGEFDGYYTRQGTTQNGGQGEGAENFLPITNEELKEIAGDWFCTETVRLRDGAPLVSKSHFAVIGVSEGTPYFVGSMMRSGGDEDIESAMIKIGENTYKLTGNGALLVYDGASFTLSGAGEMDGSYTREMITE